MFTIIIVPQSAKKSIGLKPGQSIRIIYKIAQPVDLHFGVVHIYAREEFLHLMDLSERELFQLHFGVKL